MHDPTPAPAQTQHSPASERNRQPILEVLQRVLPATGQALEIASGTGQHVAWVASHIPRWIWQPSDREASALIQPAAGTGPLARAVGLSA